MIDIDRYDRIVITENQIVEVSQWYQKSGSFNLHSESLVFNAGLIIFLSDLAPISKLIHRFQRISQEKAINLLYKELNVILYENKDKSMEKFKQSTVFVLHNIFMEVDGKIVDSHTRFVSGSNEKEVNIQTIFVEGESSSVSYQQQMEAAATLYRNFISVNEYVANVERERIHVEKTGIKSKSHKGKRTKTRKVITISKNIFIYDKSAEKRLFNRITDTWGVRGHWRQYKTGKKTWVQPHVKGNGEKEAKEYVLQ